MTDRPPPEPTSKGEGYRDAAEALGAGADPDEYEAGVHQACEEARAEAE